MREHVLRVHEEQVETFSCDQCDRNFNSKSRLYYHMKLHHDEENKVQCDYCGKMISEAEKMPKWD